MWIILNKMANRPFVWIALVFLGVNLLAWYQTGIVTSQEAIKYIRQGSLLYETGHLGAPKYLVYLPVILLVWCCKAMGLPFEIISFFQIVVAGIALAAFFRLVKTFSGQNIAFGSTVLLAGFIPLQQWNLYLFADSLFISISILFSYLVAIQTNQSKKAYAILLPALFFLVFTRPHALLFIPAIVAYFLFNGKTINQTLQAISFSATLLVGMYLLANRIFTGGEDMNLMLPFVEEHIICFVPNYPGGNPTLKLSHEGSPLFQLFYYAIHNPGHFLRLTALKILYFFNLCRPYYSNFHNAYLLTILIPVYSLAIAGLAQLWKSTGAFKFYLFTLLLVYPFGATLQCDDWHSRFSMAMIPYICWSAVVGLKWVCLKFIQKTSHPANKII